MYERIEKKEQPVPDPHDFHELPWDSNTILLIDEYASGVLREYFHHWYFYYGLSKDKDKAVLCAAYRGDLPFLKFRCRSETNSNLLYRCVSGASLHGHLDVVRYLVSLGADITARNNEAVVGASAYGHLDVVRYLVSLGADVTSRNNNYAIRYAAEKGHLDVVKYLVSVGADITVKNNYAVRWAARKGHLDVVQYLVSVGAPPP